MHTYKVGTFRAIGMEAKWTRARGDGSPLIVARDPQAKTRHQREQWWVIDAGAWNLMQELGIREGFDSLTLLGDLFSIDA